jgi:hypothetical protein
MLLSASRKTVAATPEPPHRPAVRMAAGTLWPAAVGQADTNARRLNQTDCLDLLVVRHSNV